MKSSVNTLINMDKFITALLMAILSFGTSAAPVFNFPSTAPFVAQTGMPVY